MNMAPGLYILLIWLHMITCLYDYMVTYDYTQYVSLHAQLNSNFEAHFVMHLSIAHRLHLTSAMTTSR